MTVDAENETTIANAGGLRPLVGLLVSENVDTQRRALCCLGNLTLTTENQQLVAAAKGVPRLVVCMQSPDTRVQRDATRTLRHLAFLTLTRTLTLDPCIAQPHRST